MHYVPGQVQRQRRGVDAVQAARQHGHHQHDDDTADRPVGHDLKGIELNAGLPTGDGHHRKRADGAHHPQAGPGRRLERGAGMFRIRPGQRKILGTPHCREARISSPTIRRVI